MPCCLDPSQSLRTYASSGTSWRTSPMPQTGRPSFRPKRRRNSATSWANSTPKCSQIVTLTASGAQGGKRSRRPCCCRGSASSKPWTSASARSRHCASVSSTVANPSAKSRRSSSQGVSGTRKATQHEGMFSDLEPLFDQIDEYYREVNVSLLAEERRLKAVRRSLRVTPDDRLRWEHIRDACREASRLLAVEDSHSTQAHPHPYHSSSFAPSDRPPPPSAPHTGAPQPQPAATVKHQQSGVEHAGARTDGRGGSATDCGRRTRTSRRSRTTRKRTSCG
ncbi:hypothetical protein H4582DRAFT_700219 [Lactarius indigo]|nr:hypothetical protein H4582DRAFT_700219 [Lactarius indigo]